MTYVQEDKLAYTPVFAGNQQTVVTKEVTVTSGQGTLNEGAVVVIAEGDKATLCDKAQATGDVSLGVVLGAVDATDADAVVTVAVTGEFAEDNLVFAEGTTADDIRAIAEAKNMYFRKLVNQEV